MLKIKKSVVLCVLLLLISVICFGGWSIKAYAHEEDYKTYINGDIKSYKSNDGFEMRIVENYESQKNYDNAIVKVRNIDEYNTVMIENTGETDEPIETPRALAFININGSKIVYKIVSDTELSDDELFERSYRVYLDNLCLHDNENELMSTFAAYVTEPGHGYKGYGFDFGSEWKNYGQWATKDYTLNGKPSSMVSARDLCTMYVQTMTLYCVGQNGGEYYCQLQILNIVWRYDKMKAVNLTYNNLEAYSDICPCVYDDYAPKATQNSSNVSYGVNYGVNSSGIITFGGNTSMSVSKSDCNVIDKSNKFENKVSLFYEFGGTYSQSTMYLNSFVIVKKSSKNSLDQVAMNRQVSANVKCTNLTGNSFSWNVFTTTNILFKPNVI